MTKRIITFAWLATITTGLAGCVTVRPPSFFQSSAHRDWDIAVTRAQQLALSDSPIAADSVLVDYATRHAGSSYAMESLYWRALIRLDPQYGSAGAREALPLLDLYLADQQKRTHRDEAVSLKRAAEEIMRLNTLVDIAMGKAQSSTATAVEARGDARAAIAEAQAREAEFRRLRDELAKANAELERIKKRLAELEKKKPGCCPKV
jgi:hypothetical protein